ncbi:hypothetical protein VNI00_015071 [Paramarasmius palmivorus]|uniref:Uncharacterized protein n=1 Tax=Paramarasmius palmivorus TaxID=297713 RepID=A0AAW0BNN6_9AGAR
MAPRTLKPRFPSTAPIQAVAAAQAPNGQTMLFYQDKTTGDIILRTLSNGFTVPTSKTTSVQILVPGERVLPGTPLATAQYGPNGNNLGQVSVYFFSQNWTLSEYKWTDKWLSVPNCGNQACIDSDNYEVERGSRVLYAMGSSAATRKVAIRVGHVSKKFPGTVSEANRQNLIWKLAKIPT